MRGYPHYSLSSYSLDVFPRIVLFLTFTLVSIRMDRFFLILRVCLL